MSPTATSTRVVLERRFNGPPATANGGYACGVVARHVDGPAMVSLRRPVPLGTPLELERHDDGHVTLHDGSELIAEADPDAAAGLRAALPAVRRGGPRRRRRRPGACPRRSAPATSAPGPHGRPRRRFGPLPADPALTGAVLLAGPDVPQHDGVLADEIVWAALDCPSYTPPLWGDGARASWPGCARSCSTPVPAGEPLTVVGWSLATEGRKHRSATAILASDGRMLARAEALWIRLRG